jgi:hypothetical protein
MTGNARRTAVARVMPQKPDGTIQMTPDDDGRWKNGVNRDQAFGMETSRHKQMSELIDALKRRSGENLNAKLRAARTADEKNRASREYRDETFDIQRAKVEEDRAHMDNKDAIGRYWDRIAPSPNRIDGRDNRRYVDKIPRPVLAPNPPRRLHQGRWQELRNGNWVNL